MADDPDRPKGAKWIQEILDWPETSDLMDNFQKYMRDKFESRDAPRDTYYRSAYHILCATRTTARTCKHNSSMGVLEQYMWYSQAEESSSHSPQDTYGVISQYIRNCWNTGYMVDDPVKKHKKAFTFDSGCRNRFGVPIIYYYH